MAGTVIQEYHRSVSIINNIEKASFILGTVVLATALVAACVFGGAHLAIHLGYGSLISNSGLTLCLTVAKMSAFTGSGLVGVGLSLLAIKHIIMSAKHYQLPQN